jgi:hypothetical protein
MLRRMAVTAGWVLTAVLLLPLAGCGSEDSLTANPPAPSGSASPSEQAAPPASAHPTTVRCQDLPHLWSGAEDVAYDAKSGVVHFVWPDGVAADVSDTEAGCSEQPGLEGQLDGYRDGALASERASCRELQYLVDAVRVERRRDGLSTTGSVPVSDAAQAAAARAVGASADAAVAKRRAGGRMFNLDEADKVLEQCPQ